jgi:hypothetical protein
MNTDFLFGVVCGLALSIVGYIVYAHVIRSVQQPVASPTPDAEPQPEPEPAMPPSEEDTFDDDTWEETPLTPEQQHDIESWLYDLDYPEYIPPIETRTVAVKRPRKTKTTVTKPRAKKATSKVTARKTRKG